jgi:hypothetical protein
VGRYNRALIGFPGDCFYCSSNSGLRIIAVMLGPLRMDIQTCIDTYLGMAPDIFPLEGPVSKTKTIKILKILIGRRRFPAEPLEKKLQDIISKHTGDRSQLGQETMMRFEYNKARDEPRCKVLVPPFF